MSHLAYRQQKIQEKRKNTPWRDFVMEICSWFPLVYGKGYAKASRFPKTNRIGGVVSFSEFEENIGSNSEEIGSNFIESCKRLLSRSQFPHFLRWGNNENCDYADIVLGAKNCYLSANVVTNVENVAYSRSVKNNVDNVIASVMVRKDSANVFESSCIIGSFNIFFSHTIQSSSNIRFSQNLINCKECILCEGLINQSYCIQNKQYTKEEYEIEKASVLARKNEYYELAQAHAKTEGNQGTESCFGNGIVNSSYVHNGYYVNQTHYGNNVILFGSALDNKRVYDVLAAGSPDGNDLYAGLSLSGEHIYCSCHCASCSNVFYSYYLDSCSFCLGCIGLKNKSYCILNKQYTKEERYEKVDEIFGQMETDGTLGQFFPATMNPFYFNDTAAYLIDPTFTKEEVTRLGYLRRDEPIKVDIPSDADIVSHKDLDQFEGFDSDGNRTINQDILKKVIQDEQGNYYRIIPMEYKFLVKHGLPLPRKHWLERMKENFRIH